MPVSVRYWGGTAWHPYGRAGSIPPVDPGGPEEPEEPGGPIDDTDPLADAGSLPLGQATYDIPAGAVFVAPGGSDGNGGTQQSPVSTLARAIALAPVGGTVVVRGGTYNEGSDTQDRSYPYGVMVNKSITIQNYPGEVVWFDGSVPVTGAWTQNGSRWSIAYDRQFNRSPTSIDGADDGWGAGTGAGGYWTSPDHPVACWPDMVLIDGSRLQPVEHLADVGPGTFYIEGSTTTGKWFQGTRLHIGDNPAGREVRYANKCKFMTLTTRTSTSTLRGIGIRRYASYNAGFGVLYTLQQLTLENVIVEDTSASFLHYDSVLSGTVTKFTSRRVGMNVLGCNISDDIVVDRADMRESNYSGFYVYGPAISTIKFNKIQRPIIKNSIFKDANTSGFWVDSTCDKPLTYNCLFENLSNRGVDYETASDGVIANCKFIHNGADTIFINDSDTTRIYNCTLAENQWSRNATSTSVMPVLVGQSRRSYDNPAYSFNYDNRLGASYYNDHPQRQWTINSITIRNTVIARTGVNTYAMIALTNASDNWRAPNRTYADMHPDFAGNVYHWTSQPQYPWIMANGYQTNPVVRFTLPTFQSLLPGLDAGSSFTTSDPLDSEYKITNQTYHNNAVPLPTDIATLIGQPAGIRHAGAFW